MKHFKVGEQTWVSGIQLKIYYNSPLEIIIPFIGVVAAEMERNELKKNFDE